VLDELRANGGDCGSVPDEESSSALVCSPRAEGVFAETAGGVTIASLRQMIKRGTIDPNKSVVAIISGHGLKTLDAIVDTAIVSSTINPSSLTPRSASIPPASDVGLVSVIVRLRANCARSSGRREVYPSRLTTVREGITAVDEAYPGIAFRVLDDRGGAAALRERLRRRRGRAVP